MKTKAFLIFDKDGFVSSRKVEYTLKTGQIAVKINFDFPASMFKSPILEGTIKISEEDLRGKVVQELEFELKRLKSTD